MQLPLKKLYLRTIGRWLTSDLFAYRMPVSVKGICFIDGKVILLKNERNEWDLPGGKIGRREGVKTALKREIKEELGIEVQVEELLEVFTVRVKDQVTVLIILYLCTTKANSQDLQISQESFEIDCFSYDQLYSLNLEPKYLYRLEKMRASASHKEI